MERILPTLSDLKTEVGRFIESLVPSAHGATLVTLSGELGAGKTAFTQAVARAFGVEETVTSPTFVLEKIYVLHGQQFKRLIHIDAYRLEKSDDLTLLGFDEFMQDAGNLILLEWPENVAGALPEPAVKISLLVHTDGSRILSYG